MLCHMQDQFNLVHDVQELLLIHIESIQLDLAHLDLVSRLVKLDCTESKGRQDCYHESDSGAVIRNYY